MDNFWIEFSVDGYAIDIQKINSLAVGDQTTVSTLYTFSERGFHITQISLDVYYDVLEFNKKNNNATRAIAVGVVDMATAVPASLVVL